MGPDFGIIALLCVLTCLKTVSSCPSVRETCTFPSSRGSEWLIFGRGLCSLTVLADKDGAELPRLEWRMRSKLLCSTVEPIIKENVNWQRFSTQFFNAISNGL